MKSKVYIETSIPSFYYEVRTEPDVDGGSELKFDPTITRIREIRHRISEKCEHDPRKVVDYYIAIQQKYTGRLLSPEEEMSAEAPIMVSGEPVLA